MRIRVFKSVADAVLHFINVHAKKTLKLLHAKWTPPAANFNSLFKKKTFCHCAENKQGVKNQLYYST